MCHLNLISKSIFLRFTKKKNIFSKLPPPPKKKKQLNIITLPHETFISILDKFRKKLAYHKFVTTKAWNLLHLI